MDSKQTITPDARLRRRRRISEIMASVGMVVIALSLFLPLLNLLDTSNLQALCWPFAIGTVLFWGARCIDVSAPDDSMRLRRLRRLEFWSGACFGVAAFFWFYHMYKAGPYAGALYILRDTILFSLAGAVLQLIASWLIYYRVKKGTRDCFCQRWRLSLNIIRQRNDTRPYHRPRQYNCQDQDS